MSFWSKRSLASSTKFSKLILLNFKMTDMKNILSLTALLLLMTALVFTSCDDSITPAHQQVGRDGALPILGTPAPNFYDLTDFAGASSEITLDVEEYGDAQVSSVDVWVSYSYMDDSTSISAGPGKLMTVSDFPSDLTWNAPDAAAAAGISTDSLNVGGVFKFTFTLNMADGEVLAPNTKVDIPLSCPSDLAGMYDVHTVYHQHDFLPDYAEADIVAEVTQVDDGIYSVEDASGGLYSEGPYVDAYGTSGIPFTFREICGQITWEGQKDDWQDLVQSPDYPSEVDPNTGVFTLSILGTVYGEHWTSTYTPQQ